MAAWAGILAYTGFQYSAVDHSMSFNAKNGIFFWSNGYQYGTLEVLDSALGKTVILTSKNGDLMLSSFILNDFGKIEFKKEKTFIKQQTATFVVSKK